MIVLSDQFSIVSARLFTFGGIAFCLKILPLKAITVTDVTLELEHREVAVGLLSTLALFLCFSAVTILIRDYSQQRIRDEMEAVIGATKTPSENKGSTTLLRSISLYNIFSVSSLVVNALFPIVFGLFVFILCFYDVGTFYNHAYGVVVSEFFPSDVE